MSYRKLLTQPAVYWPPGQPDGFGQTVPGDAVQILVRWQDEQERAVDSTGVEFVSFATVYSTQKLALDGWLWLGKLADAEYPSAPRKQVGARQVRVAERSQSPRNRIAVYKHRLGGGT